MVRPFILLLIMLTGICCKADTLHVYFPTDEAFLDTYTQRQLDKMIGKLKSEKDVLVIGYADERGDTYYNDMLSLRRAQSVAKYLQEHGITDGEIKLTIGKGEISRSETDARKQQKDRRVDIVSGKQGIALPAPVKVQSAPLPKPKPIPESKAEPKPAAKADEIDIDEVKEGETLTLNNIQFLPGVAIVTEESFPELDNLFEELKDNEVVIRIEGHVCCYADPDLSKERAKTVYAYLRKKGISSKRMDYEGFSNTRPLVPEVSEFNRAKNRRVEIRIIKK